MMLCGDCEILSLDNITIDWRERSIKYARNVVGKCLKLNFIVDNDTIIFKSLIIPFFNDHRIASILATIGRAKESRIFYKDYKTSIYIEDDFLYKINTKNIRLIRSKICGNFASTNLNFCLGNDQFMIIGKDKELVLEAFN
ncbi:hypothetical protein SACC_32230 [Saccharolobus caldissimus]|uniref:Uncharacterized protein n=2 Tax=Saccharolobus caldissimus TaxID=1702097 RepID=A0AAQ4CWM5_9CREN|nr:hypothetical protein SACC_32230 [Saccharolobus caldissimus]